MAYPTCDNITTAANRIGALAADLGTLATLVCTDPEGDHHAAIYAAKEQTLKECCLAVRDMQIDIACYPFGANSVILFDDPD